MQTDTTEPPLDDLCERLVKVEVTQADRYTASRTVSDTRLGQAMMRGDADDHPRVQLIARHRIAAQKELS